MVMQMVWSSYLQRQIDAIERVQRRATKIVPSITNTPYEDCLCYLKLPTLQYQKLRGDLIMVYKNLRDESLKQPIPIFKPTNNLSTRGHNFKLYKENCKTEKRKFTFSQRITNHWNTLTFVIVNAPNINKFKMLLENHFKKRKYNF